MVGVDYTDGPGHAAGVGRYARELCAAMARLPDEGWALRLVEFGRAPRPMEGAPLRLDGPGVRWPVTRRRLGIPRRAVGLMGPLAGRIAAGGCDLFHQIGRPRPSSVPCPRSFAIAGWPRDAGARAALGAASRSAAGVITFSSWSRELAERELGVDPRRLHLVPVGSDHWERDLREPPAPRPTRDILVLGSIRPERRHVDVLAAFGALRAGGERARLLVVGRPAGAAQPWRRALEASPVRGDVLWIDDPVEARLPRCVAGASALLHLADGEATAVTALEAARVGVPVVASAGIASYREALGDAGIWVEDGGDHAAVASALAEALRRSTDTAARERLAARAAPCTWAASAAAHVRAWERMLGTSPPRATC